MHDLATALIVLVIVFLLLVGVFLWYSSQKQNGGNGNGGTTITFLANLNAQQEIPANNSTATGNGAMTLTGTPDRGVLNYEIIVNGITSAIQPSHFHLGFFGMSGDPIKTLATPTSLGGSTYMYRGTWKWNDTQPLTEQYYNALLLHQIYVNIHSTEYPNGEIRAQLIPMSSF